MLNYKSVLHVYLICLVGWAFLAETNAYFWGGSASASGSVSVSGRASGGGIFGLFGKAVGAVAGAFVGGAAILAGGALAIGGAVIGGAVALAGGVIGGAAAIGGGFVRGFAFGLGGIVSGKANYDLNILYKQSGLVWDVKFNTYVTKWNVQFNYPFEVAAQLFARIHINARLGCLGSLCATSCGGGENNFLFFVDFLGCHHCHCNKPRCPDGACNGGCVDGAQPQMGTDSNGCIQCTCVKTVIIDCPSDNCLAGGCEQGYSLNVYVDENGCKRCQCQFIETR